MSALFKRASPASSSSMSLRTRTLRVRLTRWAGLVLISVVAALATAGVVRERRELLRVQQAAGASFLQHLVEMAQFRSSIDEARAELAVIAGVLGPNGVVVELARPDQPAPPEIRTLSVRPLALLAEPYELRYGVRVASLRAATWRSAATFGLLGLAAAGAALAALNVVLRARLAYPLRRLAHQIRFMRSGGGWEPVLPAADAEITEVNDALCALGPAIHDQVQARIEAERRAAAARVLSELRTRLRPPKQRLFALLGDLQARAALPREAKQKVRAAVADLEELAAEIEREERAVFGTFPFVHPRSPNVARGGASADPAPDDGFHRDGCRHGMERAEAATTTAAQAIAGWPEA